MVAVTPEPCASEACAEADPMSPCVCRCGGWGHAAKTQPPLFTREALSGDMAAPSRSRIAQLRHHHQIHGALRLGCSTTERRVQ